jgi:hypothetical protein
VIVPFPLKKKSFGGAGVVIHEGSNGMPHKKTKVAKPRGMKPKGASKADHNFNRKLQGLEEM